MCQIGDIILVKKYKDNGKIIPSHSFVVIDDQNDEIQGLPYDFVANPHNNKDGFVKADQWYYFAKDKISYRVIGSMKPDIFALLMEFIEESDFDFSDIIDNLK